MTDVDALVAALTLDEKAALTAGADLWSTVAVDRVGIPSWGLTDGPNGARGLSFDQMTPSACVPCGAALGATWNPTLIEHVGAVVGDQARTKNARVLLAPTVNLHRSPLGGRTFEAYSEDPLLTGLLAAAYVRGAQAQGVACTVKHFAGNEAEYERNTIDSVIDERALRELYLLPFELSVREGGALGIMTAYNRLNGTWCSEHPELLTTILRDEWGFDGFVVTDWFAVDSTVESARAGLDLEMPGPARRYGNRLADAVRAGELDESVLDGIVRRILGVFERLGALDDGPGIEVTTVDRPEHRAVARRAAVESIVLLRNDGVLPFDRTSLTSLAVIGPNADRAQIIGGGSASLEPHYRITPLEALRRRLGDTVSIIHERGCDIDRTVPAVAMELDLVFSGEGGEVVRRSGDSSKLLFFGPPSPELTGRWSVQATGTYVATVDGPHQLALVQAGRARVLLDGEVVLDGVANPPPPGDAFFGTGSEQIDAVVELVAGKPAELTIELSNESAPMITGALVGIRAAPPADLLDRAVAAASAADAAVVIVGTNDDWETEGHDRTSMDLPGGQDELVRRICAANPRTAVVLNAGSPVALPWADDAPALLDMWFGGQEMADALVDVLTGAADPGGRLPTTFPERIEHTPAFGNFPGAHGEVRYGESVLMGYRWYEARRLPVRFPFGHGLSYTTFSFGEPEVVDGDPLVVRVRVSNTGERGGSEVVQLYVEPVTPSVFRPPKELKAFAKLWLEPGQSATAVLRLGERAFAHWQPDETSYAAVRQRQADVTGFTLTAIPDPVPAGWRVEPGDYRLHIGRSSADIAHVVTITRP